MPAAENSARAARKPLANQRHFRFTYEIAPVFILMEHFVLERMRHIIGFTDGDSILAPGGAISNLYSIIVARHKMFPECKSKGMRGLPQQLVIFTSEHVSTPNSLAPRAATRKCQPTNLVARRATTRAREPAPRAASALTTWSRCRATSGAA